MYFIDNYFDDQSLICAVGALERTSLNLYPTPRVVPVR